MVLHDTDGIDVSVGSTPVPVVVAGLIQTAFKQTKRPPRAERSVLIRQSWFVVQDTEGRAVSDGSTPVPVAVVEAVAAGLTHRALRHTNKPPRAERSVLIRQSWFVVHATEGSVVPAGAVPSSVVVVEVTVTVAVISDGLAQTAFRHINWPPIADRSTLRRQS